MSTKVLIIGGLGFIGKNLYENLINSGYTNVDILSFESLNNEDPFYNIFKNRLFIGSIEDSALLDKLIPNYDVVFSLAGISGASRSFEDPVNNIKINLIGHINILQACSKSNKRIKVIFPSSRLVYGKPNYIPVDENHPINPQSIYAVNKYAVEQYYLQYSGLYNIDAVVLRISNPFGPNQSFKNQNYGILNNFIFKALKNEPVNIYGDGFQKRDFLYIKDLTNLLVECITNSNVNGKVFNVGATNTIKLIESAKMIKKFVPELVIKNVPWPEIDKKIETGDYLSDISKIKNATGWSPKYSLDIGLKETIDFYKNHLKFYE